MGSLLRLRSHVVDVSYVQDTTTPSHSLRGGGDAKDGEQSGGVIAHVAVEVEAVVSQPEQRRSTHTNTFRYAFSITLPAGARLRRVLPTTSADVERLARHLTCD